MAGAYRRGVTVPVRGRGEHGRRHLDPDGPVEVGAVDTDTEPSQRVERRGRRMPVVVVRADADQRDLGRHRAQELRHGRGRPVVRDRHQLGGEPAPVRIGGGATEQIGLCRRLGVAGEQHAPTVPGGPYDERGVVGFAVRVPVGPPRVGPEHGKFDVADEGTVAGRRRSYGDTSVGGDRQQLGDGRAGVRIVGPQPQRPDP